MCDSNSLTQNIRHATLLESRHCFRNAKANVKARIFGSVENVCGEIGAPSVCGCARCNDFVLTLAGAFAGHSFRNVLATWHASHISSECCHAINQPQECTNRLSIVAARISSGICRLAVMWRSSPRKQEP